MKFIYYFTVIFVFLILIWNKLTKKYLSPYTLTIAFGKKGVGKTLSMQKDLIKHHNAGWHCYCNTGTDLDFVKKFDPSRIYSYNFPRNSFLVIDEINLYWDNRDFSSMDKRVIAWFREQRKHGVKIYGYSQTFDVDKKLRDLSDRIALQRKFMRMWTVRRYYIKEPIILTAEQTQGRSGVYDNYRKVPLIYHGVDITYIPKYCKYYDTNHITGSASRRDKVSVSSAKRFSIRSFFRRRRKRKGTSVVDAGQNK